MNILRKKRRNQLKKPKFKRLVLLVFFLIMSTFAWFVYYKVLNAGIEGHISSWNVDFIKDEQKVGTTVDIEFDTLYPSMPEQIRTIAIKNNGDAITKMSYKINEVIMLGHKYEIVKVEPTGNEYYLIDQEPTINENKIKIKNVVNEEGRIPFTIKIENTDELLGGEQGKLDIKINWSAENDVLDTKWGYDVAKYFEQNPTEKSMIKLKLKLNAYQIPKSDYPQNGPAKK